MAQEQNGPPPESQRAYRLAGEYPRAQTRPACRISLGSYDVTNAVWAASKKPAPKPGERGGHRFGWAGD